MMNRLAILCSGQAGQHAGMFDLVCADVEAERRLHSWPLEDICGHRLCDILSDETLLFSNRIAQPLVVAAILAIWEAVKELMPAPAVTAGYSIGELASWSVAGAISPEKTIELAALRANLMQACIKPKARQAMLAISSPGVLRSGELRRLLRSHGFFIAIEVDEDSVVVGGLLADAAMLEAEIVRSGGRVTRLPIEVASHTPLMEDAVPPFEQALTASNFKDPTFPVLTGISATRLLRGQAAASALSRQMAESICWHAVMDGVVEAGATVAIELGPGSALSKMLKSRHPQMQCRSIAEFRSLAGVKKWVERYAPGQ
jgi:[acyl-carrier-protein] S-malonyltransferase